MHSVLSAALPVAVQPDPYAISAEFYDVLQAHGDDQRVRRLYGPAMARARHGVLDVGAGTGRVTLLGLAATSVGVHAVEPARAMRAPLMSRLSALPAEQRARVSVHPYPLDEADLHGVADVAVCHNTLACLTPAARNALWPSISAALVPGGGLLLQLPPARLPERESVKELRARRMGDHEYGGRMVTCPAGDRIRTRFDYWVRGAHGVVRRHTETFWMWPATRSEILTALRRHGFVSSAARHDPAVLAVTRCHER